MYFSNNVFILLPNFADLRSKSEPFRRLTGRDRRQIIRSRESSHKTFGETTRKEVAQSNRRCFSLFSCSETVFHRLSISISVTNYDMVLSDNLLKRQKIYRHSKAYEKCKKDLQTRLVGDVISHCKLTTYESALILRMVKCSADQSPD